MQVVDDSLKVRIRDQSDLDPADENRCSDGGDDEDYSPEYRLKGGATMPV